MLIMAGGADSAIHVCFRLSPSNQAEFTLTSTEDVRGNRERTTRCSEIHPDHLCSEWRSWICNTDRHSLQPPGCQCCVKLPHGLPFHANLSYRYEFHEGCDHHVGDRRRHGNLRYNI